MSEDTSMADTVVAKTDQLNADDLIDGPIIATVTRFKKVKNEQQPVFIYFEADRPFPGPNGWQPYKPCMTMRRVLRAAWGDTGATYVGKSLKLYRDPDVKMKGQVTGGIRIDAMSHIDKPLDLPLTDSRGSKKMWHINVLKPAAKQEQPNAHPLAPALNALKVKWSKAHNSKDQEKFAEWVQLTSNGTVLESDALVPNMYTADVIEHLAKVLDS